MKNTLLHYQKRAPPHLRPLTLSQASPNTTMRWLLHPYYVLHALVIVAYIGFRVEPDGFVAISEFETRVVMVLAAVAASKLRTATSAEGWTATVLLYGQTAVVAMLFQAGARRSAALLAFLALGPFFPIFPSHPRL